MGDQSPGRLSVMRVLTAALFVVTLQCSWALSPTDCTAAEPEAEKALELINKGRRSGYHFLLLRVADAHLDRAEPATVYYLVLDVQESDCWVLSGKHLEACEAASRRTSEIVIGQCKVIATRYSNETQDLIVNAFNCTTSSVSSALRNTKDSPVLYDFFEDTEPFRKQADKALDKYKSENDAFASFRVDQVARVIRARGGEGTVYFVDFSVRNCSAYSHFPRGPNLFGFCRADLKYDVEASDLETPINIAINCEVFHFEECRNVSGMPPHRGHPHHFGRWKHPFNPNRSRDHHHPHKPHKVGYPPPPEEKNKSDRPPLPPPVIGCLHHPFGTHRTHTPPHNHSSSEHDPHGHPPHGHRPHGHHPHGHPPHGHHPHGHPPHGHPPHGHPPHGHHPHGHPPHGHPPHGHHPHGHPPHGHHPHGHHPHGHHPHGHHFHDYGPCDPPDDQQFLKDLHRNGHGPGPGHGYGHGPGHGHGPPHRHSGERGPGKGRFPFHKKEIGYVYRLPPLNIGEVLPLPEANFPSFPSPNCSSSLQPFPQPAPPSESCPGKFKTDFPQLAKFFAYTSLK
ncbi:PREDICTED: histidine-rich glycoprotein [Chinchilla lanigera]|uniref:Histidine-rich glycoprotein n=1 Tax=Chinchilla lanigera TaxID=34839 RepID=A0A8C2W3G8_CHILA|nr:PREDICTED: histidine-rich glycoprotein [Chinchilla lanigera]